MTLSQNQGRTLTSRWRLRMPVLAPSVKSLRLGSTCGTGIWLQRWIALWEKLKYNFATSWTGHLLDGTPLSHVTALVSGCFIQKMNYEKSLQTNLAKRSQIKQMSERLAAQLPMMITSPDWLSGSGFTYFQSPMRVRIMLASSSGLMHWSLSWLTQMPPIGWFFNNKPWP